MREQTAKRDSHLEQIELGLQAKIIGWVEQVMEGCFGRNVGYILMNRVYEFAADGRAIPRGFVDGDYAYERCGEDRGKLIGLVRYY